MTTEPSCVKLSGPVSPRWISTECLAGTFEISLSDESRTPSEAGTQGSRHLEQAGGAHVLDAAPLSLDERVPDEARAGHAVGMADGDRPAVDVELVVGDAQPVAAVDHLHRERLVQLPEPNVLQL